MENSLSVYRNEQKYLLNEVTMRELDSELRKFMIPDRYSVNGPYKVKSLYFDTIDNMDFFDKENGVFIKKKIRLRMYDEKDEYLKLECKEKVGELQHKSSLLINHIEAKALMNADYSFLLERNNKTAAQIYCILQLGVYRPVMMVEYSRKAYVYPEYNTRITFDSNIKYNAVNKNIFDMDINYGYARKEDIVLEIKYNKNLVKHLKKIISGKELVNISYSKYEIGRIATNCIF